ncbi:hypothetical protein Bca4012_092416 [Brassica carinata]|uniref:Uncharacterized protein n=1 Tax=Brassica carinata TaxID=52824 RepID=A0A8X7PP76_BRACI|nr:hypothetical protein Bca52824_074815 [Brassica carinata]
MKTLPDLSTLIEKELDLPRNRLISMLDIMGLDGTSEANPQTKPPPSSVPEENVGHCGHDADWGKSEEEEEEEKLAEKPSESREGNVAREDDLESEPVNDPIVPTDTVPSTTQDASPPGLPLKREKKKKTDSVIGSGNRQRQLAERKELPRAVTGWIGRGARKGSRQNSRVDELKVVNGNRVGLVLRGLRWNLNELAKAIDGLLRDNQKESGNRKTELDKLSMEEPKD